MSEMIIQKAVPEDAEKMLAYLRQVGGETDNLSFGSEGLPYTLEEEAEVIRSRSESRRDAFLLAKLDGEIIGVATLNTLARRMSHRAVLGISVLKAYWGQGVGRRLMAAATEHAKQAGIEIISLDVRSDNHRAIRLYESFGFKKIGTFPGYHKLGDAYHDFDMMVLNIPGSTNA